MTENEHISANLFTFYIEVARLGKLRQSSIAGIPWVSGPSGGWPGYLLGGANPDPSKVKEIAEAMAGERVPALWIMESDPGNQTEKVLSAQGLRMINYWTGMYLEASVLNASMDDEYTGEIRKVTLESEMDQWVDLVNRVIMNSSHLDRHLFRKLMHSNSFCFYGLWDRDEILSTSLIFVNGRTAGLYFLATDEMHQGKGYGTAIAVHAMKEALDAGVERFVLHSTRQGLKLYQKAGFRALNRYDIYWLLGKR